MYISFLLPYNIRHTKAPFLWVFYKQLSSFKNSEVHYIGNKDYFSSPRHYHDRWELSQSTLQKQNYDIPTERVIENLNKSIIVDSIFDALQDKYSSYTQIYSHLLTTRYKPLEEELDKLIRSLVDEQSIDAILSWCNIPSLQAVADKYNLKVIYNELGPVRSGGVFSVDLAYLDFSGVNGNTEAEERYRQLDINKSTILSHEEILTLIVQEDYLPVVLEEEFPTYEVGIVLQVEDDSNMLAYANDLNSFDLISLVQENFKKEEILIRPHPGGHLQYDKLGIIDSSKTSIEFIKKCRRIVTINSSVALESILLKKPTYILGDSPISFLAYNQFDIELEKIAIAEVNEKLNFIVFNYLISNDFIFMDVYYKFRLSDPTEEEIYQYHVNYLSDIKQVKIEPSLPMESMMFKQYLHKYHLMYDTKQKLNEKIVQEKEQQLQLKEEENIVLENKVVGLVEMVESMRIKNRLKRVIKKAVPLNKNQVKEIIKKFIKSLAGEQNYIKLKNLYNQKQMDISSHDKLIRTIDFEVNKVLYIFPVIDWNFRIQRPQHIASQFRNDGYKVIYFSTFFNISKDPGYILSKLEEGIFNVTLFLDENKNIYKDSLNQNNIDFLLSSILKLEKDLFINKKISIIDHPFWFDIADRLSGSFTIYDCMDYHEGFGDESKHLVDLENIAMTKSDLLVLSSQDLYNRFSKRNENVELVRNGCEFSYFNTKPQSAHSNSTKKQIGYYGAISSWFDTDLVIEMAKHYPDYNFILIGAVHRCDNIQGLKAMDNITLVGEIPYDDLTKYLYSFDVCIMPFKINELTHATNPVKVYEYLAAGKPVVSTLLPEVEIMGDVVYTAANKDEFITKIDEAISDDSSQKQVERIEFSKSNDWANRYDTINKKVNGLKSNFPKVSIVIVTYNNLDFTKNCLESMERFNNYDNCEVIIVDNLSSDGTREYLAEYEQDRENIKVILHNENSGFAGGNNIGIKASSGDYVILLNNDTYVTPNWIVNLLKHFNDDKIAMVGPRTNNIGNESKIDIKYNSLDEMIQKSYDIYYKNVSKQYEMEVLAFFCVAIKREIIDEIGLLDEIYGIGMFEDDDYCQRVKNAGYRLVCADDVFIHHHLGASFDKDPEWKENLFKKNKAIFESRYGAWIPHEYRSDVS